MENIKNLLKPFVYRLQFRLNEFPRGGEFYSRKGFYYYKTIFIHIPKCAGLSVAKTLFNSYGPGHSTIKDYKRVFTKKQFDTFFKFSFVRHPVTRCQSAFFYLKKGGISKMDKDFSNKYLTHIQSFEEFVLNHLEKPEILNFTHFRPQIEFLLDEEKSMPIDFLGKFENLSEDFAYVKKRLNTPKELHWENKTDKPQINVPAIVIKKLSEIYEEDFSHLPYIPDDF